MRKLDKQNLRVKQLNFLGYNLGKEADKRGITEKKLKMMMDETRTQVYNKTYEGTCFNNKRKDRRHG